MESAFVPAEIDTEGVISGVTLASVLGDGAKAGGALGVRELNPIAFPVPAPPKEIFGMGLVIDAIPDGIIASFVGFDKIVDKEFALESDFS